MAGKKKINIGIYDNTHQKNLQKRAKQVQKLYQQAVQKIIQKAQPTLFDADPSLEEFHFSDFPQLAAAVDGYILQMGQGLQSNVEDGDIEAWTLANTKNDAVVNHMTAAYKIPRETLNKWKHPHLEALAEFMARKTTGMNLSDGGSREDAIAGVWNLKQFKEELELALETGIGQGKSAAELARDVKQYLKNPDKLFRRVRERVITDENGNKRRMGALRLSKAAAAYHPGRGVYRSSYKNALRLTATENNIAYRTADHMRWNALDFVLGQEIRISNNHTLNGQPFEDICDDLAGRYPKQFKFTGWHPWCRCYAVSILADEKEVDEYCKLIEQGKSVENFKFTGMIGAEEAPEEFKNWVQENSHRIAKAQNMPYFLKDNPEFLQSAGYKIPKEQRDMFVWSQNKPKEPKTLLERAAERHAARTKEQIEDIKKRWKEWRSPALGDMLEKLKVEKIDYNAVSVLKKQLTEEQIISRLQGGDMTKGSCASLAYAYIGSKAGYDILDYRGGKSCDFFSRTRIMLCRDTNLNVTVEEHTNDFVAAKKLLDMVKKGEEYMLMCGKHAAIIRMNDKGTLEYLEMQSGFKQINGFTPFNGNTLKQRFGAQKSHTIFKEKYKVKNVLVNIKEFMYKRNFQKMLGYINTDKAMQKKGFAGSKK